MWEWQGVGGWGKEGGSSSLVVSREQQEGGEWVVLGCWGWGDDDSKEGEVGLRVNEERQGGGEWAGGGLWEWQGVGGWGKEGGLMLLAGNEEQQEGGE